jgi:hypothetical protein
MRQRTQRGYDTRRQRCDTTLGRLGPIAQKIDAAAGHLKPLLLFLTGTGAGMAEAIYLDWRDVDTTGAMAIGPAYEIRDSCGASILQTHSNSLLRRRRQSTVPVGDQLL